MEKRFFKKSASSPLPFTFLRLPLLCYGVLAVPLRKLDRLADTVAQIIQLRPACLTAAGRSDINDIGRMERENTLDTLIIDDAAHGEHLVDADAFAGDHGTAEDLRTGLIALDDLAMHIDGIADLKVRCFLFRMFCFYCF
jgi:hypothetical protein